MRGAQEEPRPKKFGCWKENEKGTKEVEGEKKMKVEDDWGGTFYEHEHTHHAGQHRAGLFILRLWGARPTGVVRLVTEMLEIRVIGLCIIFPLSPQKWHEMIEENSFSIVV